MLATNIFIVGEHELGFVKVEQNKVKVNYMEIDNNRYFWKYSKTIVFSSSKNVKIKSIINIDDERIIFANDIENNHTLIYYKNNTLFSKTYMEEIDNDHDYIYWRVNNVVYMSIIDDFFKDVINEKEIRYLNKFRAPDNNKKFFIFNGMILFLNNDNSINIFSNPSFDLDNYHPLYYICLIILFFILFIFKKKDIYEKIVKIFLKK